MIDKSYLITFAISFKTFFVKRFFLLLMRWSYFRLLASFCWFSKIKFALTLTQNNKSANILLKEKSGIYFLKDIGYKVYILAYIYLIKTWLERNLHKWFASKFSQFSAKYKKVGLYGGKSCINCNKCRKTASLS